MLGHTVSMGFTACHLPEHYSIRIESKTENILNQNDMTTERCRAVQIQSRSKAMSIQINIPSATHISENEMLVGAANLSVSSKRRARRNIISSEFVLRLLGE